LSKKNFFSIFCNFFQTFRFNHYPFYDRIFYGKFSISIFPFLVFFLNVRTLLLSIFRSVFFGKFYISIFHFELENRLNSISDEPLKLSDLNRVKGAKPPPPPPRTVTGLKSLIRTNPNSYIPRKLSRNGSNGSLLTNRPILAKSTTFSSV